MQLLPPQIPTRPMDKKNDRTASSNCICRGSVVQKLKLTLDLHNGEVVRCKIATKLMKLRPAADPQSVGCIAHAQCPDKEGVISTLPRRSVLFPLYAVSILKEPPLELEGAV